MDKLYIIVRNDLAPGLQTAQACHALRAFVEEHPEVDQSWHRNSNNLVVLQVEDEEALLDLADQLWCEEVPMSVFSEPDLDDSHTAIAAGPTAKRLVSELRLALREKKAA